MIFENKIKKEKGKRDFMEVCEAQQIGGEEGFFYYKEKKCLKKTFYQEPYEKCMIYSINECE